MVLNRCLNINVLSGLLGIAVAHSWMCIEVAIYRVLIQVS